MDIERIKQLIDVVADERIGELTIDGDGKHLRIVRLTLGSRAERADEGRTSAADAAPRLSTASLASATPPAPPPATFTAPMAGTFYRAASREGEALVQVGSVVTMGTPLCVIEAMKILNEVESDRAGTVTRVMLDGGEAVERGQALFEIDSGHGSPNV